MLEAYIAHSFGHINRTTSEQPSNNWYEMLNINNKVVKMKMDTGSQANVICKKLLNELSIKHDIKSTKRSLTSYTNHTIKLVGVCTLNCKLANEVESQELEFFVTEENHQALLGCEAMRKFELIKATHQIEKIDIENKEQKDAMKIIEEYKEVFKGLGKINKKYSIKLAEGAIPS
ncbi:hypothetical protein CBL_21072, partial [Carabus blaptoides fortunei]